MGGLWASSSKKLKNEVEAKDESGNEGRGADWGGVRREERKGDCGEEAREVAVDGEEEE